MFPYNNIERNKNKNPYINDLIDSLKNNHINLVNGKTNNKYGVFDLLFKLPKTDIYYLNFIENTPERKFGFFQTFSLMIIILVIKLFRKKILWVIHNKISHNKENLFMKTILFYFLINTTDKLITHSKEGVNFGNTFLKDKKKEIIFLHHPTKNNLDKINEKVSDKVEEIDILIWGAITKYKAIDTFLNYVIENNLNNKYKIYIIGKISDETLENKFHNFKESNIIIKNKFLEIKELEILFSKTKFVLFTYAGYSTLSSGALMDTLSYGKKIIGPNVGAFKDLKDDSLIETYTSFDELFIKLENQELLSNTHIKRFLDNNIWDNFAKKVIKVMEK